MRVHLNVKNVATIILNTSGYPNIMKYKTGWSYEKNIKKVRHRKWFKTKEEAIKYKLEFEST